MGRDVSNEAIFIIHNSIFVLLHQVDFSDQSVILGNGSNLLLEGEAVVAKRTKRKSKKSDAEEGGGSNGHPKSYLNSSESAEEVFGRTNGKINNRDRDAPLSKFAHKFDKKILSSLSRTKAGSRRQNMILRIAAELK